MAVTECAFCEQPANPLVLKAYTAAFRLQRISEQFRFVPRT
jgi:hypothetical protein